MSVTQPSLGIAFSKWFDKSTTTVCPTGNQNWDKFFWSGLGIIGAITTVSWSASCFKFLWRYFLRPNPQLASLYGGSWAVITGGSAGIGFELAKSLVSQGINIVLIARGETNLNDAAKELSTLNNAIHVRVIVCDASDPDYESVMNGLRDIGSISLLFNNVGVHNDIPTNVEDMSPEECNRIISVNCNFQVHLTSLLIPKLKMTKHATVVNISSLTSKMAMPMLSVYAATKAFEEHWSLGLAAELAPYKINVLCLRPGLTVSRMSGIATPSFFCPTARTMAEACLRMLGSGEQSIAPYWPHAVLDIVNGLVPSRLSWDIVRNMHMEKRESLLKKHI
jgi:17beta-estradiol 17-dehydrogenase / very-long-chain 3-oxoacyl-CoA reductase